MLVGRPCHEQRVHHWAYHCDYPETARRIGRSCAATCRTGHRQRPTRSNRIHHVCGPICARPVLSALGNLALASDSTATRRGHRSHAHGLVELTEACGRVKGSTSSCHEGLDLTATSVGSTIMHAGTFRPRGISGAFAGSLCMRPSLPVAQAAPYRHTRTGTHRSRQSCSGRGIATPLESMKTSVVVVTGPVAN